MTPPSLHGRDGIMGETAARGSHADVSSEIFWQTIQRKLAWPSSTPTYALDGGHTVPVLIDVE